MFRSSVMHFVLFFPVAVVAVAASLASIPPLGSPHPSSLCQDVHDQSSARTTESLQQSEWRCQLLDRLDKTMEKRFPPWTSVLPPLRPIPPFLVEVHEADKEFIVRTHLGGVEKGGISVTVGDGVLHISAQRKEATEKKGKGSLVNEIFYEKLDRVFEIPASVNEELVSATFKDGVLEMKLAKREGLATGQKKKIDIL